MASNRSLLLKSPLAVGTFEFEVTKPPSDLSGETVRIAYKTVYIQDVNGQIYPFRVMVYTVHAQNMFAYLANQEAIFFQLEYMIQLENRLKFHVNVWKRGSPLKDKLYCSLDTDRDPASNPGTDTPYPGYRKKLWPARLPQDLAYRRKEFLLEVRIEILQGAETPEVLEVPELPDLSYLQDDEPSLVEKLSTLHLNEDLSDIKIVCDNVEFPCHKLILSSRSEVFKTMFNLKNSKENLEGIIQIDDVSAETMRTFLKFLYKDELKPEEIDCNLLIAAEKYDFKRLYNICSKYLERKIDANSVMETTVTAYLVDDKHLLQEASNFIFKNRGSIRRCQIWDQIKSKHPAIAAKVMDLMVFDNKTEGHEDTESSP